MVEANASPGHDKQHPVDCKHANTQLIAKDKDAEYVECLDCGSILEAGELPEPSGFDESLSDA